MPVQGACAVLKVPLKVLPAMLACMLVGVATSPATAQSVQLLGEFRDWSAYTTANTANKLCFVMSRPVSVEPSVEGLEQPYFYVSHRPNEAIRYEVNLVSGYAFAPDSTAVALIGSQQYVLFTDADAAWLENVALSADMAAAIRAGSTMTIEGTTERGIRVRETFSLSGATASMRAIDGECL
jgi:invasion protein IalB